ncbi:SH3 domain-containing protein [Streptomyces sp. NPDC041003]|uniref:SH3 domain-containing protein n=1 Tax=Streptomyces sp. NPDC041003 TaxID=3155730 RepID=UPI0033E731F2
MLKPTRTILALAAGSLVLGLAGAGAAVADDGDSLPPREIVVGDGQLGTYPDYKHAIGKVVSKGPLKVRSKPTTDSKSLGHVYPHSKVEIECKKYGEKVDGNRIWYRLYDEENLANGTDGLDGLDGRAAYDKERWVSARYVKNLSEVKYCH